MTTIMMDTARELARRIIRNTTEFLADRKTHEAFSAENAAIWREAAAEGVVRDVAAIIRRQDADRAARRAGASA